MKPRLAPVTKQNRSLKWRLAMSGQGWRCAYCDVHLLPTGLEQPMIQALELHKQVHWYASSTTAYARAQIDHVIPRSKGGTDDEDNLVLACPRCNTSKGNRTHYKASPLSEGEAELAVLATRGGFALTGHHLSAHTRRKAEQLLGAPLLHRGRAGSPTKETP